MTVIYSEENHEILGHDIDVESKQMHSEYNLDALTLRQPAVIIYLRN